MSKPPNTILEKAYWKSPVQVLTGLTWFVAGFIFAILLVTLG